MSSACSEILWLRGLLSELGFSQTQPTPLHADNTSAIRITENPVFHERTKHIEVDCHFIRDEYDRKIITLPHISTEFQLADIFTKGLPRPRHEFLVRKLLLVDSPHQFEGGVKVEHCMILDPTHMYNIRPSPTVNMRSSQNIHSSIELLPSMIRDLIDLN